MRLNKRAQAAMEFLTTYGWMMMIAVVALGGLSYFGVFNTSNFISESCKLDGALECPIFAMTHVPPGYDLDLQLKNLLPVTAQVTQVRLKETESTTYCEVDSFTDIDGNTLSGDELLMNSQDTLEIRMELKNDGIDCPFVDSGLEFAESRKKRYDVEIYYLKDGSTRNTVASGTLIVEAK